MDGKNYFVNGVYRHEGFNNQTLVNDIALLRVSEPINFPNALPIKMVSDEDVSEGFTDPGVMSWVTGWGLVNVNPNTFATVLQKVQLPIVSLAQASEIWGSIPLTDLMAGYINGNKDACNGDSGGPLVVPVFGEYKVAGIVSWGSPQCSTYGAYTRVSDFLQWIRSKTGLPVDFKPPVPVGDTMICRGTVSSTYSIDVIPTATAYHWELFPAEAGIVTENAESASISWNEEFTGTVDVVLRVTIDNSLSDWSRLKVHLVKNTRIISQSADTTLCEQQSLVLSVNADGQDLSYTWYKNGEPVPLNLSGDISFSKISGNDSGNYLCKVSGTCGTLYSNLMSVAVLPLTDISSVTPDEEVNFGGSVTLEVVATGHNLTYKWRKDNILLANSDSSYLQLKSLNATDIGLYQSTVTGTCGTEISNLVYVYVRRDISSNGPDVLVWPTLTSSEFNIAINTDNSYNVQIFSSMGRLLREKKNCRYQTTFNISTMPAGVYIINVSNSDFRKSIKIIKE